MKALSHFEFSWPVAGFFGLMVAFTVAVTPAGGGFVSTVFRTRHGPVRPIAPAKPAVLVVTSRQQDQFIAQVTVNPRGYRLLSAETASAAEALLQRDSSEVSVILVDTQLAEVGHVIRLAHALAPSAKLITLRPEHTATDISAQLMQAI
jgi:hypothetical protein